MDRLAFNAVAAINEQRIARQMVTNELANVSTVGFKRSFEASVRAVQVNGPGLSTRMQPQSFTEDFIQLKAGTVMATGNNLDVALTGSAVLGVTSADGQLAFTRRGDLRVNANGVLENGSGHLVRGKDGSPSSPSKLTAQSSAGTRPNPLRRHRCRLARCYCATPARSSSSAARTACSAWSAWSRGKTFLLAPIPPGSLQAPWKAATSMH